jgi:hypothetical protein
MPRQLDPAPKRDASLAGALIDTWARPRGYTKIARTAFTSLVLFALHSIATDIHKLPCLRHRLNKSIVNIIIYHKRLTSWTR